MKNNVDWEDRLSEISGIPKPELSKKHVYIKKSDNSTSGQTKEHRNLHKLFYKDYFKYVVFQLNGDKVTAQNKPNNSLLLNATCEEIPKPENVNISFPLTVVYPGLITGVGIDHQANIEGEFKLGVHFDYTYGMPVVYGSSVKGVLSAYFVDFLETKPSEEILKKNDILKKLYERIKDEDWKKKDFEDFRIDIFESKNKSIYNRDIFFDAVIVEANKLDKILDSDTLCPHGENPLKNPIPISFLKIASGVKMEFRFKLVDSEIGNKKLTADEKKTIFETILKTVGVGAKTNVGYGQFTDIKPEK
ncbi:type III-B CRISPR module RAMP protein Cmr6 [Bacteroidia bacterium]|nr:type III-B CRISPR module RAMP protein Cmr6 [Bacteroidia bacterium]